MLRRTSTSLALVILSCALPAFAADTAQVQADLAAIITARDQALTLLNQRLTQQTGPAFDLKLEATHVRHHVSLAFALAVRGAAVPAPPPPSRATTPPSTPSTPPACASPTAG